jgi:molecular chaperone Hsp33
VAALLGEFLTAAVLLASTLKFRGSLTVQARSDARGTADHGRVQQRADRARRSPAAPRRRRPRLRALLGGGQLALTVTPERGKRYQGIVPLASTTPWPRASTHYFGQSEQLATRLYLACDGVARPACCSSSCRHSWSAIRRCARSSGSA